MVLKLGYNLMPVLRFYCGFVKRCKVALISFILLFCCAGILAAETTDVSKPTPDRYRVVQLKYISAQDGIRLLADANIVTASRLNQENTLLITAQPAVLVKAAAILGLVDSREKFAVKTLLPASEANKMPNADAIQDEIGGISVGTFFNAPGGNGYKAIIDVHEDKLFAVAPIAVMDKIVAISQRVKGEKSDQQDESVVSGTSSIEEQGPNDVEQAAQPDKLFNELLSSISEAEKGLPQTSTGQVEPRQETKGPSTEPNLTFVAKGKTEAPAADANAAQPESRRRSYEPQVVTNGDETLELTLPEKLDVINLLDLMGKYLNLNYVYDPKQVQGKEVYLKVQGPIKVKELYPLAESIMKFTELVMTRKGNLVTIVPIANALDIDPTLIDSGRGQVQAGDVIVTRIFQLSYIDNASARNLLEQMKLGAVTDAGPGTIIITGYAYRMSRVEELLGIIDKPGRPKQFKFRPLKYTTAKTLAPKIKQLVEQMGDISIAISKAETTAQPVRGRIPVRQAPGAPPQPTPTAESVKPTVFLDADERTNRILMIGQEVELTVVNDLIDALDVAQQDLRSLRVYEIQHVEADDVRKKLEELGIVGANRAATPGRITTRAAAPGQPGAPPVQSPVSASTSNPESELPTEELQVVVIEATNSLLVNASPEQHALIATIISYVDSESEQRTIPYKVYPLQNQPPGHIAEILTKLVQEVVRDKEGKIEKVVKNTEDNIIIVPDANTFSLIVYASKKNQDWIADLIKNLDKRRPQVLIDVTLVEVTRSDLFDLDLELASKFPNMKPGGTMDFLPALIGGAGTGTGTGTGDSNSSSTGFLKNRSREAFSSPKGNKAQGFYSDQHIQALLTALESKSYGRVLAKPKILVNDGQTGIIKTTDTTNVRIDSSIIPNQGTAVTNTSFQAYSAGITLEIQPNIGDGDLLLLIVKLDRTDFGTRSASDVPPDTIATNVNTIVTVPNNKTIILGGLVKLNQGKGSTKVPLLGDLPLVGGLFRSTTDSVDDSKLYVFVKANILRPETTLAGMSEIEKMSEKSRNAFEKSEDMFQNHQDWPGMKPSPVDPVRVLDAE